MCPQAKKNSSKEEAEKSSVKEKKYVAEDQSRAYAGKK